MGKLSPRRLAALVVEAFAVEGWRGGGARVLQNRNESEGAGRRLSRFQRRI